MKFRKLGLFAAAALVGAGAALAAASTSTASTAAPTASGNAAPGPGGRLWHHHRGGMLVGVMLHATRQLELTPGQQSAIKEILSNARTERRAAASNPPDLSALANPGDPNYAAALQAARSMAEARFQRQVELQSQIYNVLTPDQKAKLPGVLASMKAQLEQRRAARLQQHPADAAGATESN